MSEDISIDDLLLAVADIKPKPRSHTERNPSMQGYQPVEYVEAPATIYCTTCQVQYDGVMTSVKGMDNLYDNYQTKWCPNCIKQQEAFWWEQCFRMKCVTSKSIEK
jgi:hypothetical protein